MSNKLSVFIWTSISIISLLTMVVTAYMLILECKTTKSHLNKKYLQIYTHLCMLFGILAEFAILLRFCDVFCHWIHVIVIICICSQAGMMGFYQITRLYYCFAEHTVYSNHGYSNVLFFIMYSFGTFWFVCCYTSPFIVINIMTKLSISCGIDKNYE
eukprot:443860_1